MSPKETKIQRAIDQWGHNRAFLSTIDPEFNDWIVTVTFYTALHAVEALLVADDAPDHTKHGKRHQVLELSPRYSAALWPCYKPLYDLAHVSRYKAQPRMWVEVEKIEGWVFGRCLYCVEGEVRRLLGEMKPRIKFPDHTPIVLRKGGTADI